MAPFRKLWSQAKDLFDRLLGRKPPEPGRFEPGSKWALSGFLSTAPWVLPRREYLVYVPRGHSRWSWRRAPLLVLLHGCRQTPETVAAATRIGALADDLGCLVLLPRQKERANSWGCWNWFEWNTARGRGEAAIVAAQIRKLRRRYRVDKRRVFVAGLSSGGGPGGGAGRAPPRPRRRRVRALRRGLRRGVVAAGRAGGAEERRRPQRRGHRAADAQRQPPRSAAGAAAHRPGRARRRRRAGQRGATRPPVPGAQRPSGRAGGRRRRVAAAGRARHRRRSTAAASPPPSGRAASACWRATCWSTRWATPGAAATPGTPTTTPRRRTRPPCSAPSSVKSRPESERLRSPCPPAPGPARSPRSTISSSPRRRWPTASTTSRRSPAPRRWRAASTWRWARTTRCCAWAGKPTWRSSPSTPTAPSPRAGAGSTSTTSRCRRSWSSARG